MRERIYEVRDRGDYRQFWIPKRQPTQEEKVARQQNGFIHLPIAVTNVPQLVLPSEFRSYFLLQNLSLAVDIWVGFGVVPDPTNNRGVRVIKEQAYEPIRIPQNEVWVVASAAANGTIVYAID